MIIFIVGAFLYASMEISFKWFKYHFYKPKYNLKPILQDWRIYLIIISVLTVEILSFFNIQSYKNMLLIVVISCFIPILIKYEPYTFKGFKISLGLFILGGLLNHIAIRLNGNLMPIYADLSISTGVFNQNNINDQIHSLGGMYTKVIPLTDIFDVGTKIYSIGDLMMLMLFSTIIYYSIISTDY